MVKVEWTAEALDDLPKLDRFVQKRLLQKITWFSQNFDRLMSEPLSGEFSGCYKIRAGDWRVIYTLEENAIVIQALGHRRDIYS